MGLNLRYSPLEWDEATKTLEMGAATTGLSLTGAITTPVSITGAFTTGINIAADGTTAIAVTSAFTGTTMLSLAGTATAGIKISGICADGIEISAAATTTGLNVSADCVTGITIGAQTTAGISIGATGTGLAITGATSVAALHISGVWGESANLGGILIAGDASGTALALGAHTTEMIVTRVNVTAAVTNSSNFMANYTTMATSAAMADGFIMGHYIRCNINHLAYENYAMYGRMNVTVAQTGDSANQFIGVFGNCTMSGHAHALLDTGGCYGVLGTASIATGGTLDQPLIAGYFDCNAVDNIAGVTLAVKARMQGYTDFGVEAFCQTNNATAGFHIRATAAAVLPVGILFTGENVGGQGSITKAFKFAAATNCGIAANTNALTLTETSHHIVVDIAGTNYYVPIFDKSTWN
jgi:hypothetical protein